MILNYLNEIVIPQRLTLLKEDTKQLYSILLYILLLLYKFKLRAPQQNQSSKVFPFHPNLTLSFTFLIPREPHNLLLHIYIHFFCMIVALSLATQTTQLILGKATIIFAGYRNNNYCTTNILIFEVYNNIRYEIRSVNRWIKFHGTYRCM